ncbi:HK97 family phage prohead protease [Pseudomonas veronii]|uniref:HK97 family phage prohead protease n=1 Tax=Pseudomonas veronii TaxID=76761 RepID=UPI000624FA48|nr:HK97 family phage prohead protease [Pseudomonas veronii]
MQTKQRLDVPLTIKQVSDNGEFEGYGSVFGVVDSYSDVVVRGAFTSSLSRWKEKGRLPAMLWQHQMSEPIGIYTEMREDDVGLYVKGRLLIEADPLAKRAHGHMKAGSLTGLSIGYMLEDGGYEYDKEKGIWLLKAIDLWEVSPVTFPANDEARITDVKSLLARGESPPPSKVERALREVGFSGSQAKAFMAKGYGAVLPREADAGETLQPFKKLIDRM